MKSSLRMVAVFWLVSVVMLSLSVACTAPTDKAAPSPIEMTDQLGRTVKLDRHPQRIISLAPSNTEILYALGLGDKVVGVTKFADYPPEVGEKPVIGGFTTVDFEKVVALEPDLILATHVHRQEVIPKLERKGLTVFALHPETLNDVLESITLVGEITGKEEEASHLVSEMSDRINAVTDKTDNLPQGQRPRVFFITWHDPLKTSGPGTFVHALIEGAGGTNIAQDATGTQAISLEAVIKANPEVIIAGIGMGSGEDLTFQFAKTEERLKNVDACTNNQVYKIHNDLVFRAGPRLADALELMAKMIHPEIFGPPEG